MLFIVKEWDGYLLYRENSGIRGDKYGEQEKHEVDYDTWIALKSGQLIDVEISITGSLTIIDIDEDTDYEK